MVDSAKQVAYWRAGAEEELAVAHDLLEKHRWRHCLFFAHLTLEKVLKALVCRETHELAPRIHNLLDLARLARVPLTQEQAKTLAEINNFCREGRYPDEENPSLTSATAHRQLKRAEEFHKWFLQRF